VLAGFLLTVVWSAPFVDDVIGENVVHGVLGPGASAGIAFAFVSGLAGTFTACNIAVFGTMAPMLGAAESRWRRARQVLRPLGWLSLGMVAVSAAYGIVVALVGTSMPQFSTAEQVPGVLSGRSIQAMVVFGVIGLALCYLGLAALDLVRDPFAGRPTARLVFLGALVGGFLIGRPFPLFREMFRDAAESGNVLYGAAAFTLQSLGNIVVLAVLLVLAAMLVRRRPNAARLAAFSGAALLVVGVFTVLYWDVRLLAMRGVIEWYPLAPWVNVD
jgi:hypothetical protein